MSDHTNILANRMRSATSAAQRKILMQQAEAMNFAAIATVLVTNQQYDASLPWSESVKPRMAKIPKRSFLEGREYSPRNQQELDLLLEVYGRGIRVTKSMQAQAMISMASDPLGSGKMQADVSMAMYHPDDDERQAPQVAMADRDQQELLRVVTQVADALVNAKIKCAAAQRSSAIRSTPADAAVLEGINRLVTKALEEAEKLW